MIIDLRRFNLYLLPLAALTALPACQTHKSEKQIATLRVHIQVIPEPMDFSTRISVNRNNPVTVIIDRSPFLTEANVESARVVDVAGGYNLHIQFDRQGSWLLQSYTASNVGKHLALFSAFKFQDEKVVRWLGAPIIRNGSSKGILSFVPDATRDEAEAIAAGLNRVAAKRTKADKW